MASPTAQSTVQHGYIGRARRLVQGRGRAYATRRGLSGGCGRVASPTAGDLEQALRTGDRFRDGGLTGVMVRCDIDPRVGGRFVLTDRRPDGDVEHTGEYLVIDRPSRLVFTFGIPAASPTFDIVTIEITPESDGGCTLQLTAEMQPEWMDYVDRARQGWGQILASWPSVLSPNATAGVSAVARVSVGGKATRLQCH